MHKCASVAEIEHSAWYHLNRLLTGFLCKPLLGAYNMNSKQQAAQHRYRVFIKYCVLSFNFLIFLNSASSAAALVFYLPGMCTHTDHEGKQIKARVRNSLKSLEKNTIFNEHPVGAEG